MTDAGEEFYRYAVLMLREAELAETAIRHRLNESKGTVRCTAYAVRNARYRARLSPPLSEGPCRCHATDQNVDIVGEAYAGSRLKPLTIWEGTARKASLPAVLGKTRRTE
jgi:DNA-binding transcriptional LysR family regulator